LLGPIFPARRNNASLCLLLALVLGRVAAFLDRASGISSILGRYLGFADLM
jgi:hypothetical protein